MLKLTELQVSSRNHPIGLDEQPVFSWKMVSDIPDTIQTAYRVRVGSWDTGRVESGDSLFVPYAGPALQPRTAYRVQVEVWDNHGQTACAETGFETGLQGPDGFAAQWIADPFEGEHPLPVFETEFAIDTPVTTARLYITAHGIYEAELDGAKLGDVWFAPGWTSYHKRLQYQTIPVDTARLTPGRHTLRVTVANGWYKGALGFVPSPNHYGDRAALLAMLCLDGRTVATGEGWRVTTGPVQRAEFYYGEDYDAAAPRPPLLPGLDKKNLIAQEDEPVRCVQRCSPAAAASRPLRHRDCWPPPTARRMGRRDRTTFPFGQGTAGTVARAVKTAQTCPRKILYSAVWQQLCQHTCPEQRTEQKIDNKQKREPPVKCGSRFCP